MNPSGRRSRRLRVAAAAAAAAIGIWGGAAFLLPRLVDEEALRARAERHLEKAFGRPASVARARVSLFTGPRLHVEGVAVLAPPEARSGTWTGRTDSASVRVAILPLLRGAIEARSIRCDGLEIARAEGSVLSRGAGQARLTRDASGAIRARGEARGRATSLSGAPEAAARFEARRVGEDLRLDSFDGSIGPLHLRAQGTVAGLFQEVPIATFEGTATLGRTGASGTFELALHPGEPRLRFRVSSPFVDLDELIERVRSEEGPRREASSGWLPAAHAAARPEMGGPAWFADLDAEGAVEAAGGRLRGVALGPFTARVRAKAGHLRVQEARFEVHGGRGEGTLEARLADEGLPFSIEARLLEARLATLTAELSKRASGILDGKGSFVLELTGRAGETAIAPTLQGTARLSADEGTIKSVGLVKRLGEFLQITGGRAGEADETPFDRLTATLRIADGVARTDDLEFRSRDLDLDGGGTIAFGGALALDVVAALSPGASAAVVERTPQLRFRVGSDGRLTVPMKLRGTLGSPYVQVDLERVLEEGLRDEMRKRGEKSLLRRLLGR